ncbi:MAG TPA: MlaE family lipid ABC transporter permease subunit [bacterium]|nr:MlaE family lipid ABC transporter permease subunit [bacterium]HPN33593.1 MlaE family lipid ABC transporter permease subunit [bacterium]
MDQYRFTNGRLTLSGPLLISNVGPLYEALNVLLASYSGAVELDLTDVSEMDSAGVAMIDLLAESLRSRGLALQVNNLSSDLARTMTAFSLQEATTDKEEAPPGLLERLGEMTLARGKEVMEYLFLTADAIYYSTLGLFNRQNYRKGEFTNQCIQIGMNAFPIVALIAFLIGFILALQSAAQLRQFGAAIYVADLIAISMTREMGPLITAIIFSGRSGSAIASEIATMKVTEETDALKSMGLNPIAYVLTPKIYAIVLMMPLLTILSVVIGILGAMVIGWSYLEISPEAFYREVLTVLYLRDITTGLIKSLVFAWLIALTGAYYGFRVRGGAEGVGRATTASVVTSIFLVILADSILGLVFYFGRGLEY